MVSVSVSDFFYQPMDEKIKTWTLRFLAKKNPNVEKLLFDWPIVLRYVVKAKYRLISRKFSGMKFFSAERSFNQPKATRVCIRSINQSNRSMERFHMTSRRPYWCSKTMKRQPCLCSKQVLWELNSFLM